MKKSGKSTKLFYLTTAVILTIMFCLAFFSVRDDSLTFDEVAHIGAGYSYLTQKDMRLNPEHPPLVKDLAALPLLFLNLDFQKNDPAWLQPEAPHWWLQFDLGHRFIYQNTVSPEKIIFWSRLPMIFLLIIFAGFVFYWSKKLFGGKAGLLALFLFAFSPTLLAHGRYVATDVPAAFGVALAIFCWLNFLKNPNKKNIFFAGLAFALSLLIKFSAILLIPFFALITIAYALLKEKNLFYPLSEQSKSIYSLSEQSESKGIPSCLYSLSESFNKFRINLQESNGLFNSFLRQAQDKLISGIKIFNSSAISNLFKYLLSAFCAGLIALLLIWPVYQLHIQNLPAERQIRDTKLVLENSVIPDYLVKTNIWLSGNKITRGLGHFLFGILMAVNRSSTGNTTYFLGKISGQGFKTYFPIVYALKEPLAFHILTIIAILFVIVSVFRCYCHSEESLRATMKNPAENSHRCYFTRFFIRLWRIQNDNFAELSILLFIIIYWLTSINSKLNIGVRHLLPVIPLTIILVSGSISKIIKNSQNLFPERSRRNKFWLPLIIYCSLFIVLIWQAISVMIIYPHFLAYFNEAVAGPKNGYLYATDSNLDWGQDLKRLKEWIDDYNDCAIKSKACHLFKVDFTTPPDIKPIDKIAVDYFGGGDLDYYLSDKYIKWDSRAKPTELPPESFLAVSVNQLQGGRAEPAKGFDQPTDYYRWIDNYQPVAQIGYSIFVYYIK